MAKAVDEALEAKIKEERQEEEKKTKRKSSVIIHVIPESTSQVAEERVAEDQKKIVELAGHIKCVVDVKKIIRMGKNPTQWKT